MRAWRAHRRLLRSAEEPGSADIRLLTRTEWNKPTPVSTLGVCPGHKVEWQDYSFLSLHLCF